MVGALEVVLQNNVQMFASFKFMMHETHWRLPVGLVWGGGDSMITIFYVFATPQRYYFMPTIYSTFGVILS
jgi:hypothetical protein